MLLDPAGGVTGEGEMSDVGGGWSEGDGSLGNHWVIEMAKLLVEAVSTLRMKERGATPGRSRKVWGRIEVHP